MDVLILAEQNWQPEDMYYKVAFLIISKIKLYYVNVLQWGLKYSDQKDLLPQTNALFRIHTHEITQTHLHTWYLSASYTHRLSHHNTTPQLHYVKEDPNWLASAVALPLAWVCLNLLPEVENCPQLKQVCTYADVQLKHVVCISFCTGAKVSFRWSRSLAQYVIWGWWSIQFQFTGLRNSLDIS